MTGSDKRLTIALAGLLAGLIAGLLSVVVPPSVSQLDSAFISALFGDLFSAAGIFGIVLCVYFWVFPRRRSVFGSIGFVLASTAAYILAWFTTASSSMYSPFFRSMDTGSIAGTPVLAFVLGGTVGAFVVLLAALLFFSAEKSVFRNFLQALMWSPAGGALGALGWATGPSLGVQIVTAMGQKELLASPGTADTGYYYSLYLVWQAGMGLAIGWLFSGQPVEATAGSAVPPVFASNRATRIARIALFAAAALVFWKFSLREFPQRYQSAEWQRAYKKHLAERPPMPNQPAEKPPAENLPNQLPERPSLANLPEIQLVAPEKMLIVRQFGEYVPSGVRPEPIPKAPATTVYLVTYALPGAATFRKTGPVNVQLQVTEYPNAAWARYEIFQLANGLDLAKSSRLVKFGNRVYGQATDAAEGRHGSYTWLSGNRLIALWFYSADPDKILKAYLERFPSAEMPSLESVANQHPEQPSLENLREVQLVAPMQMLILHQFGEYVPGGARALKTVSHGAPGEPKGIKPSSPNAPAKQTYSVKYAAPAVPPSRWRFGPTVEVQVDEYPNAAWAQYGIFQHAPGLNLANVARPVKFGFRIYGDATDAAIGQNGSYTWASKNRLIIVSFSSAEPDEILKAYLEKFPPPEKTSMEDQLKAQPVTQQMLVLHQLGEYVPQRPYSGTTVQPPAAKYNSVRYALPGAPTMGKTGSVVDVQIKEYPNAAWAQYEIFEQGDQINLANPARPVKFGSRIYGHATEAAIGQNGTYTNGQNGTYIWVSGNRLITMLFYFAEPDEVLKAYLEKFPPSSSTDRP